MTFFDDRKFLLSHIRHSFITCDDTGVCEMVMLNESIQNHYSGDRDAELLNSIEVESKSELLEAAQSMDIMSDMELIGAHRTRSNTAQRLERLKKERKSQSKVKVVLWKENPQILTESERAELFAKRTIEIKPVKSALSLQIEKCPPIPNNPFNEFARFDGRVIESTQTKRILIYLMMLPHDARSFPMEVFALNTARVYDLIGLICWQYTIEGKEPKLKPNVSHYSLRIAEENGEVDTDFPSLNPKEPIVKFGFPVLALVEKEDELDSAVFVTIYIDEVFSKFQVPNLQISMKEVLELAMKKRRPSLLKGVSYKLEKRSDPGNAIDLKISLADTDSLEFVLVADDEPNAPLSNDKWILPKLFAMEAPLYRSYAVTAIKYGRSAEVQLGISGEKVEVTPTTSAGQTFFKWQPKAATCNVEDVAICELSNKSNNGKLRFEFVYHNGSDYKHWTFEAESNVANEICRKLDYVMQMRTSNVRNDYLNMREQKKFSKRKFSHLPSFS